MDKLELGLLLVEEEIPFVIVQIMEQLGRRLVILSLKILDMVSIGMEVILQLLVMVT